MFFCGADFDQTNGLSMKLCLSLPEDLPDSPLPKVPPDRFWIRFPAYRDPDHGLCLSRRLFDIAASSGPQIKKLPSSELSFLNETLEGCLPADPLIRAEPVPGLQRLDLGQLFPALFTTTRKDPASALGPRTGKKAVFVPTFSLGRLIGSFNHRAEL